MGKCRKTMWNGPKNEDHTNPVFIDAVPVADSADNVATAITTIIAKATAARYANPNRILPVIITVDPTVETAVSIKSDLTLCGLPAVAWDLNRQSSCYRVSPQTVSDYRTRDTTMSKLILILLAIFLPPLAVYLKTKSGKDVIINIILCLIFWIPAVLHALYVVLS